MCRTSGNEDTVFGAKPELKDPATLVGGYQLVIAHERQMAVTKIKTTHAIGLIRDGRPIGHDITQAGYHLIREARWKVEQTLRIGR